MHSRPIESVFWPTATSVEHNSITLGETSAKHAQLSLLVHSQDKYLQISC